MSPTMGRPISEDGRKDRLLQVRLDEKTFKKLEKCADILDISRSDAVRFGINRLEEYIKEMRLDEKK